MSRYLHSHSLRLVYARGKSAHTQKQKNRANFYANLNAQKKARARSDDINYLCCSQTWKKPRFQLKMPFAWLSLTCLQNYSFSFSIFFCCDDAVCTTTCFFFFCFLFWPKRPLSEGGHERGGAGGAFLHAKGNTKKKSQFKCVTQVTSRSFFLFQTLKKKKHESRLWRRPGCGSKPAGQEAHSRGGDA